MQTADLGVLAVQFDDDGEWREDKTYPKNIVVPWNNAMWGSTRAMTAGEKPGVSGGWSYLCGSIPLGGMRIETYLSAGSFTWGKPDNLLFIVVDVIGGGGGSGGLWFSGGGGMSSGAPSGGLSRKVLMASDLQDEESVTVGAGGAPGALVANSKGGNGGTSSFGAHCSATGGTGVETIDQRIYMNSGSGVYGAGPSGSAGKGIGGHINLTGECGHFTGYFNGGFGATGYGGASPLYGDFGRGARGMYSIGASPPSVGFSGAAGAVIVYEFLNMEQDNG